ncbi:MAG TPA: TIR domain-containing protein [Candidatus Acidoferrales bacterium]|nr:TIR domain-containing protein [Candidatus Acidoferrales bacterium]
MSSAAFYDVFLSHSSKDKAVVHQLAQKLKSDGLRFWLDAWEIRAGDNIPAEIGKGLERLRSACLAMPSAPIGTLENRTFRFRDPFNNERRFILLRLDDAEPKGSITQFPVSTGAMPASKWNTCGCCKRVDRMGSWLPEITRRTETVDCIVMLSGEIDLELDGNEAVHLKQGDILVQRGGMHQRDA